MYAIAEKFRQVLRLLLAIGAALALVLVTLALVFPLVLEGHNVQETFIKSLSAWTGGPVIVKGQLRIAHFTALSVEADDVELPATKNLAPFRRVRAKSVIAFVRLQSLLLGRLEFKRVKLLSPQVVFARGVQPVELKPPVQAAADLAFAFVDRSPFAALELIEPVFFRAKGPRAPFQKTALSVIEVEKKQLRSLFQLEPQEKAARKALVSVYLKEPGLESSFRGEFDRASQTAAGSLRLKAGPDNADAQSMLAAMVPWERGNAISVVADANWSNERLTLDRAAIAFGNHSASGSLALAVTRSGPALQGTLAYDNLVVPSGGQESGDEGLPAIQTAAWGMLDRKMSDRGLDLDMRVSAERFKAGRIEGGPLAVALSARDERASLDIAELTIFGGTITGRVDLDDSQPAGFSIIAHGSGLDSRRLAEALRLPLPLSGLASIETNLTVPQRPGQRRALSGTFSISFPAGGILDGDLSRKLNAAFAGHEPQGGLGADLHFADATFIGSVKDGAVSLSVDSKSLAWHITGSLRINQGAAVSGAVFLQREEDSMKPVQITLSGTAEALAFSQAVKPALSN